MEKYSVITVIAATLVVFTILFLTLIMLKSFGKWLTEMRQKRLAYKQEKREQKAAQAAAVVLAAETKELGGGEEIAAITMALHLYLSANRDEESEIITIEMPTARYSPWAQKNLAMKRVVRR